MSENVETNVETDTFQAGVQACLAVVDEVEADARKNGWEDEAEGAVDIREAIIGQLVYARRFAAAVDPKYVAIQTSDDPVERLAYDLAVEIEQADLDRNDLVIVNRAKLTAIAARVLQRASEEGGRS